MRQVSHDFEQRAEEISRKTRRTLWLMTGLIGSAIIAYLVFAVASVGGLGLFVSDGDMVATVMGDRAGNALWVANNFANLAAGAALRIWWLRESKMTLLLSHALVLEDAPDQAIRVLLSNGLKS